MRGAMPRCETRSSFSGCARGSASGSCARRATRWRPMTRRRETCAAGRRCSPPQQRLRPCAVGDSATAALAAPRRWWWCAAIAAVITLIELDEFMPPLALFFIRVNADFSNPNLNHNPRSSAQAEPWRRVGLHGKGVEGQFNPRSGVDSGWLGKLLPRVRALGLGH